MTFSWICFKKINIFSKQMQETLTMFPPENKKQRLVKIWGKIRNGTSQDFTLFLITTCTAENFVSVGQRAAKLLAIKLCAGLYGRRVCKRHWPEFELYQGRTILKVWWLAILQPFDLQTPYFYHLKIWTHCKVCKNFKRLAAF